MRTIDADALIEVLETMAKDEWNQQVGSSKGLEDAIDIIENAPTVETDIEAVAKDAYDHGYTDGWKERFGEPDERPKGKWGKWVILEIQCPNCLEYFQTDCYSMEELQECPNCGAEMVKGTEE